jgi:hypothetical protein
VERLVGERTDRVGQFVDCDDDVLRRDRAPVRMGRVVFEAVHLRALEDLHAVVDQQILQSLQAQQRIDAVRAAVPDARGVALAAEDLLQLTLVVGALIGEADAHAALTLGLDSLCAARTEAEKQRVLLQQPALNVMLLQCADDALDAAARRFPDLRSGRRAIASNQLVQLELAVGSEEAGAAAR